MSNQGRDATGFSRIIKAGIPIDRECRPRIRVISGEVDHDADGVLKTFRITSSVPSISSMATGRAMKALGTKPATM